MNRFPHIILFLLLATLVVLPARAQYQEKDFTLYTVREGLSDNHINCIQQDDWGYLWIGTKAGLNRFDGSSFKAYTQGSAPLNLPSDIIPKLKKFGPHQLGIISRGGLQVLHTDSYKVTRYIMPDTTAFTTPLNAVWDAVKLPDGSYAIASAAGFYVVDQKGIQKRYDGFSIKDIGRKQMLFGREIFKLDDQNYLVYTNEDGQSIYNIKTKEFTAVTRDNAALRPLIHPRNFPGDRWLVKSQLNEHESLLIPLNTDSIYYYNNETKKSKASPLPANFPRQMSWESQFERINDSILLLNSGVNGFFQLHFDRKTGSITTDGRKYLANYEIKSLHLDKDGRLWVGTTHGLLKQQLDQKAIGAYSYPAPLPTYGLDVFTAVYRYRNVVYAGQYSRHHGLLLLDPVTMRRIKEIQFFGNDVAWNEVTSIEMYHPDTLWVGTWAGLLWFDTKSERYGKVFDENKYPWAANFTVVLAPPRKDGYAWFCARLGGRVVRYHIPTRTFTLFSAQTDPAIPFEKVKTVVYDSYGDVWISGHALARWNNRENRFDTVIKVYGGANKFNDDIVTISGDQNGSLWLHNADNGLLEYKIAERKFVSYSLKDGLPTAIIHALSSVIDNKLWIAANNRLCLMDIRTKQFTVYDYHDGLPERVPTARRIYFDSVDKLYYLGVDNYLIRFPLSQERKTVNSRELILEDITVNNNNTSYQPSEKIELNYNQNNLALRFTVVDFENDNYQFAYRLHATDSWNAIGQQHSLSFNNLSPGEYLLELTAAGKPGITKTKSILLVINPPFWTRAWFIILMALIAGSILLIAFRSRLKSVRQKANLDKQLSQTEMKALQSQMNPHFIFNSLNSIREMILSHDNREASHYLSKFAQLIRITLEQSTQETVSLRSTIDYLQRYIEMETIRNGYLKYEIVVDDDLDLDETLVSPMIIQPFVENAIWHGVSATRKDILVKIRFSRSGNSLQCVVDDNGVGIAQAQSMKKMNGTTRRSHGIANVQNRIELLNEKYSLDCQVIIKDKKEIPSTNETGTLVTIQLPYQTVDI